jgi:cold shock protein
MPSGTVKWFNPTKGYGFIQPAGGGKDVFVHISAVERAGLRHPQRGTASQLRDRSKSRQRISGESQTELIALRSFGELPLVSLIVSPTREPTSIRAG